MTIRRFSSRSGVARLQRGEFRRDLDADMAAVIVYGAIDELITGWVLGRLPGDEDDVANSEHHIVEVLGAGLSASAEQLHKARHADVST